MALLITLYLVLINSFNNITSISPNTQSFTSISIWMITCIIFIFCALLQYGIVLLIWKYHEKSENVKQFLKNFDLVCLTISVLSFISFNIMFWYSEQYFYFHTVPSVSVANNWSCLVIEEIEKMATWGLECSTRISPIYMFKLANNWQTSKYSE